MLKINFRFSLLFLCLSLLLPVVIHAKVVLDTTFGVGGKIPYIAGPTIVQPDNKILVFGFTGNPHLIRYHENGSIDNSFNGGTARTPWIGFLGDIKLQPDNKILVSGAILPSFGVTNFVSVICRLNPDGSNDAGFADRGCFSVNRHEAANDNERIYSIVVLSDGKILTYIAGKGVSELLRFNADGTPDTTFGTNGYVTVNIPGSASSLKPIANGKFLLVTTSGIARIDGNGMIDTSFGDNGTLLLNGFRGITIQPDGKIIVIGDQTRRLTSEGQPDSSFSFSGESFSANVFPDGRILIIGRDNFVQQNREVLYLLNDRGRIIGRDSDDYSGTIILNNGKFLALGGNELSRVDSVTSIANGIGDLDDDQKSEISVYRPSANTFYFLKSKTGFEYYTAATPVGTAFIEDFNADFHNELVWWTPSSPQSCYYGLHLLVNREICYPWGLAADKPVKGDFDGDYKSDLAIFRDGLWHIRKSSNGESMYFNWGQTGDKPVPADYDFDGITDAAIYRPSTGVWWVLRSSDSNYTAVQFGIAEDTPVPADYDGDGRADFAVYRPSNGVWYLLKSKEGFAAAGFGLSSDKPVPGDYDGDGLTDIAVFRPSDGNWYLLQSKNGFGVIHFGQSGDVPLSTAYSTQ